MYDYFEIFLGRMMMCRNAAAMLGAEFKFKANGIKILQKRGLAYVKTKDWFGLG